MLCVIQNLKEATEEIDFVEWGREFQRREAEETNECREAEVLEKELQYLMNQNV